MSSIEIKSKEIRYVPIEKIIDHVKNRNQHSEAQVDALCKLIKFQGFRSPLIISKRSGFLVSGHCRKLAAIKLGMTELPCVYQDFENEAQEYSFVISENEIARWAELDVRGLQDDLSDFDMDDFDIEMLGIDGFDFIDLDLKENDFDENENEETGSQIIFSLEATFPSQIERDNAMSHLQGQGYIIKAKNG